VQSACRHAAFNEIVLGRRAITADTALRLAHHFGTSEQFRMILQASFDLEEAPQ
jgi:addiction module HigA family antidote